MSYGEIHLVSFHLTDLVDALLYTVLDTVDAPVPLCTPHVS